MMNAARNMCGVHEPEAGPLADRAHPAVGGATVEAGAVVAPQDGTVASFPDSQVHRSGRPRDKGDYCGLVALAHDAQGPVVALETQVLDVRRAGRADA
jgi:hypothetical protein